MTDKQFAPTPARREQARKEGRFPRGSDITSTAVMAAGLLMFFGAGGWIMQQLGSMMSESLSGSARLSITSDELTGMVSPLLGKAFLVGVPVIALAMFAALATQAAQAGLRWMPQRIAPDLDRINPVSGMRRVFAFSRLFDGFFVLARIGIVVTLGILGLWISRVSLVAPPGSRALGIGDVAISSMRVIVTIALVMCLVAVFEYGFRWWQHENSLRMTLGEMREDSREQEGDLRVKALRRGAHQDLARRRPYRRPGDASSLQAAADDSVV
ncbi:MAG: EscU/YscU/HrcU family type III secretion system export apparatus switch protein [Planctomycetota bacterium]